MSDNTEDKRNSVAASPLDILLDIELPVTLRFGRRQMSLDDILRLDSGSIVEFDRAVNDPVEVLVNDRIVARGEAVTVAGHYGVRILEIASPRDRLDSCGPLSAIAASAGE
jgi:flagellar motor switch protein FliN/FliY